MSVRDTDTINAPELEAFDDGSQIDAMEAGTTPAGYESAGEKPTGAARARRRSTAVRGRRSPRSP